jgi:hypothetical protein
MKRSAAVVFPDTVPDEQLLFPLVPVFQPLVYCQPVENGPGPAATTALGEELCRRFQCRTVFPAPLGEDRERFLRLLSDLRDSGDDYAGQLGRLSLAAMGASPAGGTETKSAILSSLLAGGSGGSARHDRRTAVLWQARLILKLGEIFDESQQALKQSMEKIRAREKELITQLRSEQDTSYSLTEQLASGGAGNEDQRLLRMRAWARIFALGQDSPADCGFMVTADSDGFERLAEIYGRMRNELPARGGSLTLPAGPGGVTDAAEQLRRFSVAAGDLLEQTGLPLSAPGESGRPPLREGGWDDLLEEYFPAAACGRRKLELYTLRQVSPRRLFLDSFGPREAAGMPTPEETVDFRDIVIGLLD